MYALVCFENETFFSSVNWTFHHCYEFDKFIVCHHELSFQVTMTLVLFRTTTEICKRVMSIEYGLIFITCILHRHQSGISGAVVKRLKALFNNVFTLKNLSCMSIHAISVFDKVQK